MKYAHIAERVFNTPLMVHPDKLQLILGGVLGPRMGFEAPELAEATAGAVLDPSLSRRNGSIYDAGGGIRVIEINGSLVNRYATAPSGVSSYDGLRDRMRAAAADSAVAGVLLRINSFGGEVSGLWDTLDELAQLKKQKPVWAVADDPAFSAAYAIGSAADRLIVTQSGGVGSVGVIAVHFDYSGYLENEGIKPTAIFAGAKKTYFSPLAPLQEGARQELNAKIQTLYGQFVDRVAAAREMDPKKVQGTEAGTYFGKDGVKIGFADAVGTFEEAISELRAHVNAKAAGRTTSLGAQSTSAANSQAQEEGVQMENTKQQQLDEAAIRADERAKATKAAHERIAAVMGLAAAKGREQAALGLALGTDMNATAIDALLGTLPKAEKAAKNPLDAAMEAEAPNPDITPAAGGETGGEDVMAEARKTLALAGIEVGKGAN